MIPIGGKKKQSFKRGIGVGSFRLLSFDRCSLAGSCSAVDVVDSCTVRRVGWSMLGRWFRRLRVERPKFWSRAILARPDRSAVDRWIPRLSSHFMSSYSFYVGTKIRQLAVNRCQNSGGPQRSGERGLLSPRLACPERNSVSHSSTPSADPCRRAVLRKSSPSHKRAFPCPPLSMHELRRI